VLDEELVPDAVELVGGDAGCDGRFDGVERLGGDASGNAHGGDGFVGAHHRAAVGQGSGLADVLGFVDVVGHGSPR
jgi:hypothetical protein